MIISSSGFYGKLFNLNLIANNPGKTRQQNQIGNFDADFANKIDSQLPLLMLESCKFAQIISNMLELIKCEDIPKISYRFCVPCLGVSFLG